MTLSRNIAGFGLAALGGPSMNKKEKEMRRLQAAQAHQAAASVYRGLRSELAQIGLKPEQSIEYEYEVGADGVSRKIGQRIIDGL